MVSLNEKLGVIFESYAADLKNHKVIISRHDGVVVFTNKTSSDIEAVMTAGLWQAAIELQKIAEFKDSLERFQIDFHTSQSGFVVKAFRYNSKDFYISMIYKDVLNPGLLKKKFLDFIKELKTQMLTLSNTQSASKKIRGSHFLFEQLSDSEIDDAFARIRE